MVARETMLAEGLQMAGLTAAPALALERLLAFADSLEGEAVDLGFVGPGERERILDRHVLDSVALVPHLRSAARIVDVGSGAGLPGVVVACLVEGHVTLVEAERKRAAFLKRMVEKLRLTSDVRWGRSEELGRDAELREGFDAAICRALAPPPVALEYLLPFVRTGGIALIAAGQSALEVREESLVAARELGGGDPSYEISSVTGQTAPKWIMMVQKVSVTPDRYPRRTGVPSKRPLGAKGGTQRE